MLVARDRMPCAGSGGRGLSEPVEIPEGSTSSAFFSDRPITGGMAGNHFSCSLTAVLLARVHAYGGPRAVADLLREAKSPRTPEYLLDLTNWISYDEAVALWAAGARVTRHPGFARAVGEDAARRLNGSPVAALFRSLGSPEEVYRQLATGSTKFSVATTLEAVDVGPGYAEIVATAVDGFPRSADHCAWTCGLLTQPTVLFGLPPATVEHEECEALGAACCRYRVVWDVEGASATAQPDEQVRALQLRLDAMAERLDSMFATAADLIGADDVADVLARITDRAAVEVRAPRHLLAVRTRPGRELHIHAKGFAAGEVAATAERILADGTAVPASWLVVPVRSNRRDYGRLLAMYEGDHSFFAQERELLEVYARYAASALDNAAALMEARELHELARALAAAGTSGEVAGRLVDAVPIVVDCDRVGVYLWDEARGEIVRRALNGGDDGEWSVAPTPGGPLERLLNDPSPEPLFVDDVEGNPVLRALLANIGAVASIVVPITAPDAFLGLLIVSVMSGPERLQPAPELLDRLSGVAAHATTALQNGRLLDRITHQALHDELTGLANRAQFMAALREVIVRERAATLLYLDLDNFKPVNDELGHEMGDRLLMAVADRLNGCTRAVDTVARLGGDEFAVLLADEDTGGVAARLAAAFDDPFAIDGHELAIGASIGRAEFPRDGNVAEDLLRVADAAMFAAKRLT
jgi:diguanylate cyclase (GGDEF)-like protein